MSLKLQQELVLKQVLTQELRQAITLLELNCAELGEYLDQLALENPLISGKTRTAINQFIIKERKIE